MVKRALLIGINYLENNQYRLNGCINDVINVESMLIDAFNYEMDNITILRDDIYYVNDKLFPNTTNILRELNKIFDESNENDDIWLHFSGHGFFIKDDNNDETDNNDEMIITVNDFGRLEAILDDQLNEIFSKNVSNTFSVFDCCNSGTIGDLEWSFKFEKVKKEENNITIDIKENNEKNIIDEINKEHSEPEYQINKYHENKNSKVKNMVMLSGARDDQFAYDTFNFKSQIPMGALTTSLLYNIRKNKHNINLYKLEEEICYDLLSKGFPDQTPCLSSSNEIISYTINKNQITSLTKNNKTKIRRNTRKMYMFF